MKLPTARPKTIDSIGWGASLFFLLFAYSRLYFGIDFTDEALYLALPYRFALGDHFFVDDTTVTQPLAFLTLPLVRFWLAVSGGTEGIFLFARHFHFAFSLGLAALAYRFLRGRMDQSRAALLATFVVLFVPYNLFGPSYNLFGGGLFAAALWLGWERRSSLTEIGVGALMGLAALCYPTLALPGAIYLVGWVGQAPRKLPTALRAVGTCLLLPILLLLAAGLTEQRTRVILEFTGMMGSQWGNGWGLGKLFSLLRDTVLSLKAPYLGVSYLLVLGVGLRRRARWYPFLLPALPLVFYFCNRAAIGGGGIMSYLLQQALLAPLVWWLGGKPQAFRAPLWRIWFPSFLAGITFAWSSNVGINAAAIGLVPATLISLWLLMEVGEPQSKVLPLLFLLLTLAAVGKSRLYPYMDDESRYLTFRVEHGPYRGLYTTSEKASFSERIRTRLAEPWLADRLLITPHFPAGYLFSNLRPGSSTVWQSCPDPQAAVCRDYLARLNQLRILVLKMNRLFYLRHRITETPEPFVALPVKILAHEPDFDILLSTSADPR